MQINKKILVIALSISFNSAIMSMEQAQVELKEHAENLSHYMAENNSEIRKQNIVPFTDWLTERRENISVDNNWKAFCQNNHTLLKFTIGALPIFKFPGMENVTADDMLNLIMNRAYTLQPGSSSEDLANSIDQDLLALYHACFKS